MSYGPPLVAIGVALAYLSMQYHAIRWPLAWFAFSFVIVGIGYLFNRSNTFGKRMDGALNASAFAPLLPFLLLTWLLAAVQRRSTGEAPWNEVAPGIWLGRRPVANELPHEIEIVVNLTAEFPEVRSVRSGREYYSLPALDGATSNPSLMLNVLARLRSSERPIYVHCALGHGRSAMFVIGLLLARDLAGGVDEAESIIKAARRGTGLTGSQRHLLWKLEPAILAARRETPDSRAS